MTAWNPENVRQDFVLLQNTDRVYFDNAATSQKPKCVIDAVQEFYEKYNANVLRGLYPLSVEATERYENARKTVQRFIHAACPEEIIFTRNATESMNLVAYSYGMANLKAGDEILVSILEHHSNILPWQMVFGTHQAGGSDTGFQRAGLCQRYSGTGEACQSLRCGNPDGRGTECPSYAH